MLRQRLNVEKLSNAQAENLPRVTQWSDIVWLIWVLQCITPEQASELKYIFKENIITDSTQYIMEKCFVGVERDGLDIEWPGRVFYPADEQFYALLGTPHGMLPLFPVFSSFFFFLLSMLWCRGDKLETWGHSPLAKLSADSIPQIKIIHPKPNEPTIARLRKNGQFRTSFMSVHLA